MFAIVCDMCDEIITSRKDYYEIHGCDYFCLAKDERTIKDIHICVECAKEFSIAQMHTKTYNWTEDV